MNAEAVERPRSHHRGTMNLIPFRKGQSGNPGGRSKAFAECQRIAREASPEAMQKLVTLMEDSDARVSGWAADKVLERAWGKAKDYDPKDEPNPSRPKFDPRLLTPEQLDIVEYALKLMVRATRAPTGIAEVGTGRSDESQQS